MARKKKDEEMKTVSPQKQEVPEAEYDGHIGEIDKETVENALTKFNKYKDAKSAWAFNSILGKHADAMDNIPTANILPRE